MGVPHAVNIKKTRLRKFNTCNQYLIVRKLIYERQNAILFLLLSIKDRVTTSLGLQVKEVAKISCLFRKPLYKIVTRCIHDRDVVLDRHKRAPGLR